MQLAQNEIHLWLTQRPAKTSTFIREVLSHYLQQPARRIQLTKNIHGKPLLKDRRINLQFNASNSHGVTVCAVAQGLKLGVDLEYIHRRNRLDDIAERYCPADERASLHSCSDENVRREMFFSLWTRKEAWLKAQGKTIGTVSLDAIPFSQTGNQFQAAFPEPSHESWYYPSLNHGDYRIAVAYAERRWQAKPPSLDLVEVV